jgi:hypothetical protein
MSAAAFDSVLDDSGLFRAIREQRVQRSSQLVRMRRERSGARQRNWVWAVVAALLAVALLDTWNTLSRQVAPAAEPATAQEW